MRGRGKINRNGVPGEWSASNRIRRQIFRYRESREPQQLPRSPRAIVVANNLDSHIFPDRLQILIGRNCNHGCTQIDTDKNRPRQRIDRKVKLNRGIAIDGSLYAVDTIPNRCKATTLFRFWFYPCKSVCIRGSANSHRTNVSSAGPVPLAACRYATVSPAKKRRDPDPPSCTPPACRAVIISLNAPRRNRILRSGDADPCAPSNQSAPNS